MSIGLSLFLFQTNELIYNIILYVKYGIYDRTKIPDLRRLSPVAGMNGVHFSGNYGKIIYF
jgi:hypothetical protein